MIYITRKEHFNAAHRLYNPNWTSERNEQVFGPCANEYYHGHNFELVVTVKGRPDPDTGFVMDMKKLGELTKQLGADPDGGRDTATPDALELPERLVKRRGRFRRLLLEAEDRAPQMLRLPFQDLRPFFGEQA